MKNAGIKDYGEDSGEAIAKVLAGLRDTEAPDGMERRILDGLEERAAAQTRAGRRWQRPGWFLACSSVLAGLLVAALAIPAIRRLAHGPVQSPSQSKMSSASSGLFPPATSAADAKTERFVSSRSSVRSAGIGSAGEETSTEDAEAVRDSDSVAMEEMHAASQLAPKMPLTEQERLLLRLAHRGEAVELAKLDPLLLAAQDAEEKAEFQKFFGQTTTKQATPEQPTTEQTAPSATEQGAQEQSVTEQAVPAQETTHEQSSPEQASPEQPTQEQPKPQKIGPDQSTTQQPTSRLTRTGDSE